MKNKFIENELWYLSLSGAFQRNNVYKKDLAYKDVEKRKEEFKRKLRVSIEEITANYNVPVSDEQHLLNIKSITDFNTNEILVNGKLNFGTAQKLLNLYLKYLWCTNRIQYEPPHCLVDSIILQKSSSFRNERWTQLDCQDKYMLFIDDLREVADKQNVSLAKWELDTFNRRSIKLAGQ